MDTGKQPYPFYTMALFIALFCMIPVNSGAQFDIPPQLDWQIIETDHFLVSYPSELEAWTKMTASKMESIHERVTSATGYQYGRSKMDIVVMDPMNVSNGMAIPFLRNPRIILWATAPDTSSLIGGRNDWSELVFTHEYSHLSHLVRPSHNIWNRISSYLLPLSPIALKSPAWVVEGYATMLEGLLTGQGRPNGSFRSTVIRQWALEGKLPEYHSVNGSEAWMGYSMPYLMGSSYLEWLIENHGNPESARNLWKRMTAKTNRTFADAFSGVFRDEPEDLYDRFRAEMIAHAFLIEHQVESAGRVEGDRWAVKEGILSPLSISPDGKKLAVTIDKPDASPKIVIYDIQKLKENKNSAKAMEKSKNDPYDSPAEPLGPPEHDIITQFKSRNGIYPQSCRWMPDSETILFYSPVMKHPGFYQNELFQWDSGVGHLKQLTHDSGLKYPSAIGATGSVLAVCQKNGWNSLVSVDLKTLQETVVDGPSLEMVFGRPACSRDGRYAACVCTQKNVCELRVYDLNQNTCQILPASGNQVFIDPVWDSSGQHILVTNDANGIFNIARLEIASGKTEFVTRVSGGAFCPEINPTDPTDLFYLGITSKGMEIRRLKMDKTLSSIDEMVHDPSAVMPPSLHNPQTSIVTDSSVISRPYRFGSRQEFAITGGTAVTPYSGVYELGIRGGDLIGRLEYLAIGSAGWHGGADGGAFIAKARFFPVELGVHGAYMEHEPSRQKDKFETAGLFDRTEKTAAINLSYRHLFRFSDLNIFGEGFFSRISSDYGIDPYDRKGGLLQTNIGIRQSYTEAWMRTSATVICSAGSTGRKSWDLCKISPEIHLGWKSSRIGFVYEKGWMGAIGQESDRFQLGGYQTSLLPSGSTIQQVEAPFLPFGAYTGTDYETLRLEASIASFPLTIFAAEYRFWTDCDPGLEKIRIAGAEMESDIPPIPLVKLTGTRLLLGTAYFYDGPYEAKWRAYLVLSLRP